MILYDDELNVITTVEIFEKYPKLTETNLHIKEDDLKQSIIESVIKKHKIRNKSILKKVFKK